MVTTTLASASPISILPTLLSLQSKMTLPDRQELNYIQFHSAYLKPMYSLFYASEQMAASRARSRCFAQAALFEALCWVSLGSLVRYFDPDAPYLLVKGMSDQ